MIVKGNHQETISTGMQGENINEIQNNIISVKLVSLSSL